MGLAGHRSGETSPLRSGAAAICLDSKNISMDAKLFMAKNTPVEARRNRNVPPAFAGKCPS
jgi:hypothetical protein